MYFFKDTLNGLIFKKFKILFILIKKILFLFFYNLMELKYLNNRYENIFSKSFQPNDPI